MGNCFTGNTPDKAEPFSSRLNRQSNATIDQARSSVLRVETTKKTITEEFKEEEKKHVDEKNLKRNEKRGNFKIKKGGDKENEPIYEHFQKIEKKKSSEDFKFIAGSLKNHFVFYNLNEIEREQIVSAMFYCEINPEEYLFKQGDDASCYFILESGKIELSINNEVKKVLSRGEGFGELALLYSAPRSATLKALEKCKLWAIDRSTFRSVVEEMMIKEYSENRKFIDAVSFFNTMTSDQKDAIAGVLITLRFQKDQNIVVEGDPASSFYIIKEGQVTVMKSGKEIRKMNKGDSFGEQALYYNTVRGATVKATNDNVKCLTLGRDILTKILGDNIQVIVFRNQQKWALEKSALLSKLTKLQTEKILDAMKIVEYKAGSVVFKKGTLCHQKVVAVIEGSLKIAKLGTTVAAKGTTYGDEFLVEAYKTKMYDDDIIVESDSTLSEISHSDFEKAIGGPIEEVLKRNESSHEKKMLDLAKEVKDTGKNIKLEELIYFKKLGAGMFGSVFLVQDPNTGKFYALKCVSKQQILEQNLEKHLQQEKSVMEILNFPFIMSFVRTFKDNNYIYFLSEYIKGIELYDAIRIINLLNTTESQFYIGTMILAIEFLHQMGIIYRDLKPENIMVDHTGYLKLIDMGTAKFLKGKGATLNRTFTIIGTPHYMAPEILAGKGYGLSVDLWSIGICLYEFLCGQVPFGEEAEDPYEIHDEIMRMPLKYPSFLKDLKAKKLMDQLLSKVPEARLGGSFAALKAHSWFDNFDWDKLLDKKLKAPLIPPKERLISEVEIQKMGKLAKKAITVLEEENKNGKTLKKELPSDLGWDKNF